MDALITLVAAPVAAEALKLWGAYAICLLLLGVGCWALWANLRTERVARQAERTASEATEQRLQAEISRLQELRLQDAQKMIAVARSGTETMAARKEGDAKQQEILGLLAVALQALQRAGMIPSAPMPLLPTRSP